jgi:hypothetical protein
MALHHLAGDGAMHDYLVATNAFENPSIGGWLAALIVLRLQTINGNHDIHPLHAGPLWRDLPECTGYNLDVNATVDKHRQQPGDLAMAYEGIATYQGKMQGAVLIHKVEHTLHQIVTAFVLELPQTESSNMPIFVCVTSRTTQRTFPSNLDCKGRPTTAQDAFPSLNDFARLHISLLCLASDQHEIRTTLAE